MYSSTSGTAARRGSLFWRPVWQRNRTGGNSWRQTSALHRLLSGKTRRYGTKCTYPEFCLTKNNFAAVSFWSKESSNPWFRPLKALQIGERELKKLRLEVKSLQTECQQGKTLIKSLTQVKAEKAALEEKVSRCSSSTAALLALLNAVIFSFLNISFRSEFGATVALYSDFISSLRAFLCRWM